MDLLRFMYKPPTPLQQRQTTSTLQLLQLPLTVDVVLPEGRTGVKCPGRGRT